MSETSLVRSLLLTALDCIEKDPALAQRFARVLGKPSGDHGELLRLSECPASVRTLRAAIRAGELPAQLVGREYRVRAADLDAWLQRHCVVPAERAATLARRKHRARAVSDGTPGETPAARAVARARRSGALRSVEAA